MYSPSNPLLKQLQWQTFDEIVEEKQASMVFKALNNLTPAYITNLFKPACTYTNHSLRSKTSNKLHVPAALHKSLRFIGPKIWNSLSDKARKATTLTLTLLHQICSMCGFPLSNIWHVFFRFFFKKTSDEKLIFKVIMLQNQSVSYV